MMNGSKLDNHSNLCHTYSMNGTMQDALRERFRLDEVERFKARLAEQKRIQEVRVCPLAGSQAANLFKGVFK